MKERLRGQDVVVAAVLAAAPGQTHASLAQAIGLQRSHFSESVARLADGHLYSMRRAAISAPRFYDFLVHAYSWLFPAEPEPTLASGLPIAHSGPILSAQIAYQSRYIWPSDDAQVEGYPVRPIHRSAIQASLAFPGAYHILSLAEALRVGRVREIVLARGALQEILDLA